jgi:hypothetical protein
MAITPVPVGSIGFDTVTTLNSASAARMKASGFDFAVRYLGGISVPEMKAILGAGLGLQFVTYSRQPGWTPSATLGAQDGAQDIAQLAILGGPNFGGTGHQMVVWIDLEGSGGDVAATTGWVNARAQALLGAGYIPGLYVGSGCVLNGAQLYALPGVSRYWRAFNEGIPVPNCGFCQMQLYPSDQVVDGIEIDYDATQQDFHGRVPTMLVG